MDAARILIAEDEVVVAQNLAQRLRELGYEIAAIVPSGEEAVQQAGACRPDLVLMDIRLQREMDGIAAAAAIRARHDIPVVYLTGYADDATLFRARETAPFGFVIKPFEVRELRTTIEMALYKHAAEAEIRRLNADLERRVVERTAQLEAARGELERRLQTEEILAALSANLLRLPPDQVEAGVTQALQALGELTGVDLAYVFTFSDHGRVETELYWAAPGAEAVPAKMRNSPLAAFPWTIAQLSHGEFVHLPRMADAPPEAAPEKAIWLRQGIQSVVVVPLVREGRLAGALGLGSVREAHTWSQEDIRLLHLATDLFASALLHARLYTAEREQHRRAEESRAQLVESAKLAAAGQLAASLAHEINNPLQALHNSLQLLLSFSLEPAAQREYMEIAAEEVERLMGITARILDFARRPPAEMYPTHLPEVVGQVLALASKYLQHAQVAVECDLPENLPPVRGNAQELAQVVLNLVLNAVEAMPGGGQLRVAGRHTAGGRVALAISDTGHGIPAEQQEHIFEPFFSTKEAGTGLGLSVAYSIVEHHGGQVTVESRVGAGSTFTVWLPALAEETGDVP